MIQFNPNRDLPGPLLTPGPFETLAWQWLALALMLAVAWGASILLGLILFRTLRAVTVRTPTDLDNELVNLITGPIRLVIACAVFRAGLLSIAPARPVGQSLAYVLALLFYLALAWIAVRFIDLFADRAVRAIPVSQRGPAQAVLPLGKRTLKAAAIIIAVLATLSAWGFNTTALVAGLGVGGLAVALAAQKTIENFFGGIAITTDRPVVVGDFCKYEGKMGTVEDIGLRSTRIRTLDRTVISVPNGTFSGMQLENFARRDKIRFHPTLKLRLDTRPDQLNAVIEGARQVLAAEAKVEQPGRVRLIHIGEYSMDIEIFSYVLTPDNDEFLGIQERLLMQLLEVVERSGTALAVPTSRTFNEVIQAV
ncbi:MAG TPA: mechanosensitive ion channel family protein [Bryobacteraceae bacterium]|nr:mechanosensitive ion channel family protein [Bryobacteraceae bacterium]